MNKFQKILAKIVELTDKPLSIVGSRAVGTSTEDSDWDIFIPIQFKEQIMQMVSDADLTTDTYWYEQNSYDGKKLFSTKHYNLRNPSGVRIYVEYRGIEYKVDFLFGHPLKIYAENEISFMGVVATLDKTMTLIFEYFVKGNNIENIDFVKFHKDWKENIITNKIREFKQFVGLDWNSKDSEFDKIVQSNMKFSLNTGIYSLILYSQYLPHNIEKYKNEKN